MSEQIPPSPPGSVPPPPAEAPAPLPLPPPPGWWMQPPRRRSVVGRLFAWVGPVIFLLSILLNVCLLVIVAILAARPESPLEKSILRDGANDQVIAVYRIAGLIDGRQAARLNVFCRQVADDDNVKAVVLRVVSPGGTVAASDQMHSMVERLKKHGKKVVVSMGGVAASGGYYISAPADEIIAEHTTVTGSIGVTLNWVTISGTLEKIGAEWMVMRSTHSRGWKDSMSLVRKPHDRQRRHLQKLLDDIQGRFEELVRKGRGNKLPKDVLDKRMKKVEGNLTVKQAGKAEEIQDEPPDPFNGNVYRAERAKKLGLVDDIGYQDKAIERAEALAQLTEPKVVQYTRRRSTLEKMLGGAKSPTTGVQLDRSLLDELQTPRIMVLWKAE